VYYLTGEHDHKRHESKLPTASSNESIQQVIVLRFEIDLSPVDFWKKTPLEYAIEHKYDECCNIIESAISKRKALRLQLPNTNE
jgi:hypothetical protein